MIVCDTDIISAFAKAEALEELIILFKDVYIVPAVYFELKKSLEAGYTFPQNIFGKIKTLELSAEEKETTKDFASHIKTLGIGELESIVVCKTRDFLFTSFDKSAIKFSEQNGIKTVLGKPILRSLWSLSICSVERVKEIIKLIEERDRRLLDIEGIFD